MYRWQPIIYAVLPFGYLCFAEVKEIFISYDIAVNNWILDWQTGQHQVYRIHWVNIWWTGKNYIGKYIFNGIPKSSVSFHYKQRYLAPGTGIRYMMPMPSSLENSLSTKALENEAHSLFVSMIRLSLSGIRSHSDLCQARSANASMRGNIISWSCWDVRMVSVQTWPCMPSIMYIYFLRASTM